MAYKDYLQSEHWKDKRENAHKARGFRFGCIVCNKKTYDIHHLTYECLGKENISRHLIPLCRTHHEEFHEWQKANNRLVGDVPEWMQIYYPKIYKRLNKHIRGKMKKYTSKNADRKYTRKLRNANELLKLIENYSDKFVLSKRERNLLTNPSNFLFDKLDIPGASNFQERTQLYITTSISKEKLIDLLKNYTKFLEESEQIRLENKKKYNNPY